jgi:hypothetical protein
MHKAENPAPVGILATSAAAPGSPLRGVLYWGVSLSSEVSRAPHIAALDQQRPLVLPASFPGRTSPTYGDGLLVYTVPISAA